MKYEDLQNANKNLLTSNFKGNNYVLVNERVKAFRMLYPEGTISTNILKLENGVVTMKADVLDETGRLLASGLAQEKEGSTFVNKTSFIENCETSAVGRALGFLGIGIETSIASAEEVQTAILNQEEQKKNGKPKSTKESMNVPADRITEEEAKNLEDELIRANVNIEALKEKYKVKELSELRPEKMIEIYGKLDKARKNERNRQQG